MWKYGQWMQLWWCIFQFKILESHEFFVVIDWNEIVKILHSQLHSFPAGICIILKHFVGLLPLLGAINLIKKIKRTIDVVAVHFLWKKNIYFVYFTISHLQPFDSTAIFFNFKFYHTFGKRVVILSLFYIYIYERTDCFLYTYLCFGRKSIFDHSISEIRLISELIHLFIVYLVFVSIHI